MKSTGILRSWNDERGFGFIAPTRGGAEVFVHISAFPRDGSRPVVGETLSFERGSGKDGKPQAVDVVRTAVGSDPPPPRVRRQVAPASRRRAWPAQAQALALLRVIAVVAWGYHRYQAGAHRRQLESMPPAEATPEPKPAPGRDAARSAFRCDGRTQCSQMTSCAEATWFIENCPGTQMDGNHDGVPCERQWCTGPTGR